jgi:hypothetical protein
VPQYRPLTTATWNFAPWESQTVIDPPLDRAVILLDDVIEIKNNATAASPTKRTLLFKLLHNGLSRKDSHPR